MLCQCTIGCELYDGSSRRKCAMGAESDGNWESEMAATSSSMLYIVIRVVFIAANMYA